MKPLSLQQIAAITDGQLIGADLQVSSVTTDSRQVSEQGLFIALAGERFDGHAFIETAIEQGAQAALVSQQTSAPSQVLVNNTLVALQQLAAHQYAELQQAGLKTVAVTGSCGKTTVKGLLESICAQQATSRATAGNFNNHIGVPLTLLTFNGDEEYGVIELGANHVGEIAEMVQWVIPNVAMVTMVGGAHLEGFGSLDNIKRAKGEIFSGLSETGVAVVPFSMLHEPLWQQLLDGKQLINFGLDAKADVFATEIEVGLLNSKFALHLAGKQQTLNLQLAGEHNVYNAVAAAAAAHALGIDFEHICAGIQAFESVAGRGEVKQLDQGVTLINDSYNANLESFRAAIDLLTKTNSSNTTLIMGDMGELGEQAADMHAEVGAYAQQQGIEQLLCVGELSKHAAEAFAGAAYFTTKQQLLAQLKSLIQAPRTVLVKGSRSAGMEQVCQELEELFGGSL